MGHTLSGRSIRIESFAKGIPPGAAFGPKGQGAAGDSGKERTALFPLQKPQPQTVADGAGFLFWDSVDHVKISVGH